MGEEAKAFEAAADALRGDGDFFIPADASKKDEIKEWAQTIGSKASEHVGNTVVFDPKGDESRLKGFFGFADSVEVSVGLVDLQNSKKKFVMEESADLEKTLAFIAKVVAGEVEPTLKSAPIPATQEESVKVVVGKSFEDVVLGSGRNVLFKIYAP